MAGRRGILPAVRPGVLIAVTIGFAVFAAPSGCKRQAPRPPATQPVVLMGQATELAGTFAAHAVWSVSTGETLTTIAAYEGADGKRLMKRLVADRNEDAVAHGKVWLATNADHAARAVLIYDAFVTHDGARTDALIVTARDFTQGDAEVSIAIPYRPATDPKGFAVHRPKFIGFKGEEPDWQKVGEALWRGIASHPKAAEVWNKHLDESR